MAPKLTPSDVRSLYKTATLNGQTYSYILSEPKEKPIDTIFLIHGFPDLSFGWRNQIPYLNSLGLRVVVPDMMGYGGTAAPSDPKFYTYKRSADDIAALAKEIGVDRIILGGHDWGGAVVYRAAMYYPKLISAVFSVCTPFMPPQPEFKPISRRPNFKYQIQLAGPDLKDNIVGSEKIGQFLNGIYGGRSNDGPVFTVDHGCHFDRLGGVGPTPLLSKEEMDFYVERFSINGLEGPTNWYRTGELNFEGDKAMNIDVASYKFEMPFLFIGGTKDAALPPAMAAGMEHYFRSLTKGEVNAGHWALWEKPDEVNQYIKEFLFGSLGVTKASL
ncbi:Alpha/Beta hydrolase protein [Amylocarpus encephaloides]|uniref:Alpha/Beta hydrolase protein n=1 Tax=Amylocarpus encephaloides TaxID=45428 RepID=A0A9P7YPF0_9HELO|nr:Alpha/Beta hydrolase protein [Amylocarpus encephaloides]